MTRRDRYPAWFDAALFRAAFVLEPAGLPLAETRYSAKPLPPHEGVGVDVVMEWTDDLGELRAQVWRRIEQAADGLAAIHVSFVLFDDPPHPRTSFQRHGIARRSMRRAVGLYDLLGVRRIAVAATNAGRLVWPKFGFALTARARDEFVALVDAQYRHRFGKPCRDPVPRSGRELVDFEVHGHRLAETVLRTRPAWEMELDLTDRVSRRILAEELRRR